MTFMVKQLQLQIGSGKVFELKKRKFVENRTTTYRGNESLEMLEPRYQALSILGYGKSVGTAQTIQAEIVVVKDYTELEQRASEVREYKCIIM